MRFFIALEIPDESKAQLERLQEKLKQIIPQVRLTDNNKLHLTIVFVGEEPENIKESLIQIIKKASLDISRFEVSPSYIDAFPGLNQPRTLWMAIEGDTDKLFILRERIKDGFEGMGLSIDERRYIPHIAIAKTNESFRLKKDQKIKLQQLTMESKFKPIRISSIKLFESLPQGDFHIHNTLAKIPLT